MSKIHSCCVLLGSRSRLMNGTAKYSTETSIDTSSSGSSRTASPVHSRAPALMRALWRSCAALVMTCLP